MPARQQRLTRVRNTMYFTSDDALDALADEAADDPPGVIREEKTRKQDQKEEQIDKPKLLVCFLYLGTCKRKISYYGVEN